MNEVLHAFQTAEPDNTRARVKICAMNAREGFEPCPLLTHATITCRIGYIAPLYISDSVCFTCFEPVDKKQQLESC